MTIHEEINLELIQLIDSRIANEYLLVPFGREGGTVLAYGTNSTILHVDELEVLTGLLFQISTITFEELMNNDKKENYCDSKGKVLISYEVKHMTLKLLSVIKKIDVQFCPYFSDIHTEEEINYLIKDGKLISFGLSAASKSKFKKSLKDENECVYYPDEVSFDLYIEQGISYLQVWQSKICNYTIELSLKEDLVSFE
jgi:hypothetical protein